jgi:putative zinc finger protein
VNCTKVKSLFSVYLDGGLEFTQIRAVDVHLAGCNLCQGEFRSLQKTKSLLSSLGRKAAPADLALRMRLAISREAAAVQESPFSKLRFRMETALNAFMVPATAGLLSAIVIFGLLIGFFAIPSLDNDVPTMLYRPPELAISPFGLSDSISSESVVVEAYIDANGRVQDYRIVSSPATDVSEADSELKNMLIFTIFRPATSFGRPTSGRAILSFSRINVKG